MKLFKNKKSQGIAYAWIFGLVTIFVLGVLFIVFDQVFLAYINPAIIDQVNNSNPAIDAATKTEIFGFITKYMIFWHILPFILFFVVVAYMIIVTIRRERTDEQF